MEENLVAYKVWRCKFCSETREGSFDMWSHLQEKHNIGSVETTSKIMVEIAFPVAKTMVTEI